MSRNSDDTVRGVAINIGANSQLPGVRGRLWPDGSFEYLPIPEREPVDAAVPTYRDLGCAVPDELLDEPVHLDPSFAEYPRCDDYTYGDEHPVKAGPISSLSAGDYLWFYATLEPVEGGPPWAPPDWGAYLIGQFELAVDPLEPDDIEAASPEIRSRCRSNAHFRRQQPDARVVALGAPDRSGLFETALPLSAPTAGATANAYVTDLAGDSGAGPWWRRVLRFDPTATRTLRSAIETERGQPTSDGQG